MMFGKKKPKTPKFEPIVVPNRPPEVPGITHIPAETLQIRLSEDPRDLLEKKWWTYVGDWGLWAGVGPEGQQRRFGITQELDWPDVPRDDPRLASLLRGEPIERIYVTENVKNESHAIPPWESLFGWQETSRTRVFRVFSRGLVKSIGMTKWWEPIEIIVETGGFLPGQWFQTEQPMEFPLGVTNYIIREDNL